MKSMLLAARAILVEFHPVRIVAAIFLRNIIAFFAIVACQDQNRADIFLLGSHDLHSNFLLDDLGDDTRTDGQTALTDGKLRALLQRHWHDQFHLQIYIISR